MKRALRFIHTSDVHLDSNAKSQDLEGFRNIAEYSFAKVIDAVIDESVDLFLIVGDLFDHGRIKSQDFEFVQEQLARVSVPTVLIPGNHDVHDDLSLWRKFDPTELGSHVYAIMDVEGQVLTFPDLNVSIWGRAMDEHSPEFQPLLGGRASKADDWSLGMAHGQVVERRVNGSSSQITHEDMGNSGFDYIALGHVHVWQEFEANGVKACYSGSPVEAFASSKGGFFAQVELNEEDGLIINKRKVPSIIKPQEVVTHGVFF